LANTEITYLKKKIKQLETDFASFASLLIQAGLIEVVEEKGERVFKVNKVKLDA
jgi:hypothetical protein